jgi:Tat protein translocase TatB subunit
MFEVGFTEIVLILGLALLVLGPEKLPGLAQKIGRWTGRARSMARQLRTQLEQEVTMEELARSRPMSSSTPPGDHVSDHQTAPVSAPPPAEAHPPAVQGLDDGAHAMAAPVGEHHIHAASHAPAVAAANDPGPAITKSEQ